MNLKHKLKNNMFVIPFRLMLVFIICYIYYNNQNLLKIDQNIAYHELMLDQINTKMNMQNVNKNNLEEEIQKIKNKLNISNGIFPDNNSSSFIDKSNNMKDGIFRPINTSRFPTFKDLIGCDNIIDKLNDFLIFIKEKKRFQEIGDIETPLGILFYGIPGTGKTFIAHALAKESGLPFFNISSSEFSKSIKGQAPQAVKDLFASVRQYAETHQGAIIFIDECEAAFADISQLDAGRDSEIINVVNSFKEEMTSYLNNPNKPIFIIGATNHPENIEEAIKSRLTYQIKIEPSNKEERQKYLEFRIQKRNNPYSNEAKNYLYYVVNEALENIKDVTQFFKKTNRSLENILKAAVSNFAKRRNIDDKTEQINKEDIKKAYANIIDNNTTLLDQIEENLLNAKTNYQISLK